MTTLDPTEPATSAPDRAAWRRAVASQWRGDAAIVAIAAVVCVASPVGAAAFAVAAGVISGRLLAALLAGARGMRTAPGPAVHWGRELAGHWRWHATIVAPATVLLALTPVGPVIVVCVAVYLVGLQLICGLIAGELHSAAGVAPWLESRLQPSPNAVALMVCLARRARASTGAR